MNKQEQYEAVLKQIAELNKSRDVGNITPVLLTQLTQPVTEDYVAKHNSTLTDSYKEVVSAFGCNDYAELYEMAKSNKDYNSLNKVTRTVMRNGKPLKTTIYEKVTMGTDNKIKGGKKADKDKQPSDGEIVLAKELTPVTLGYDNEPIKPSELKQVKALTKGLADVYGEFKQLTHIKLLVDEFGAVRAVMGFIKEADVVTLGYLASDMTVRQLYVRYTFELIRLALKNQLNAYIPEEEGMAEQQRHQAEFYGFTYEPELKAYIAMYDELAEQFDDWRWGTNE